MSENAAEMPISEAREHLAEVIGRVRYGGQDTILTHYGSPAAVVISFSEYQKLRNAGKPDAEYKLPPELEAMFAEQRRHPERDVPYRPRRRPDSAG